MTWLIARAPDLFYLRLGLMHPWLLSAPAWLTEGRTSLFSPKGPPRHFIFGLSMFVLAITLAIFLVVASLLTYVLIRYCHRVTDSDHEPAQIYGSNH